MDSVKYIRMDVHKEAISIAVLNSSGKLVMECVIETKAATILQFFEGLRGSLHVTLEEGTWATWLYDLLKPHVAKLVVCKNLRTLGETLDRTSDDQAVQLQHCFCRIALCQQPILQKGFTTCLFATSSMRDMRRRYSG